MFSVIVVFSLTLLEFHSLHISSIGIEAGMVVNLSFRFLCIFSYWCIEVKDACKML
jgi:hypothetical protein